MKPIKVVLVDDHRIVLDGLSLMFDSDAEFDVRGTFTQSKDALAFLQTEAIDVLLTDYSIPGMTGLELIDYVRKLGLPLKCILLSMHDEPAVVRQAMKADINGFLLKNVSKAELKDALRKVMKGITYISPEITTRFLQTQRHVEDASLTSREMDVLELIIKELPNKAIAAELKISERTVETYRKNIFFKTKTSNLVGLMKYVFEHNLLK